MKNEGKERPEKSRGGKVESEKRRKGTESRGQEKVVCGGVFARLSSRLCAV